jgi:hypothetical protein
LGAVGNAWSAGMYVFAYRAVTERRIPAPFDLLLAAST